MARDNGALARVGEAILNLLAPAGAEQRAEERAVRRSPMGAKLAEVLARRRRQREAKEKTARAAKAQLEMHKKGKKAVVLG